MRIIVAIIFSVTVMPVSAMSIQEAGPPAELPPVGYSNISYVDSRGCLYIKVGTGLAASWVPRVTRTGEVNCDQRPTFEQASDE